MDIREAATLLASKACFYCAHPERIPADSSDWRNGDGTATRDGDRHIVSWPNNTRTRVWCDARVIWSALDKVEKD